METHSLPVPPREAEDTDSAFISLTLGWSWSRAVAGQSLEVASPECARILHKQSLRPCGRLWGAQTETQMDRETTCGRQRVNSELLPIGSKGIKLVTEMYGVGGCSLDTSRSPKYFM